MRNIKSILIGLLIALFILLGSAVAISYFYEDQVSQYIIEELNEFLLTEMDVEDVNFSVLKKFPNASVEFKNVTAFSKDGYFKKINGLSTDTLFYSQSIYIEVNIFDLLSNDIKISSIHFDKGNFYLFVDHLGDPNYIFWNRNLDDSTNKAVSIALQEVKITRSSLLYYNDITKLLLKTNLNKVDFAGDFSSRNYLMKIRSDQYVERLKVESINYILNKKLELNLELDIIEQIVKLKDGNLRLEDLKFIVNGDIDNEKDKLDLLISGQNLNIQSFIKNLPPKVIEQFPNIIGQKGTATIRLNISGENIKVKKPHLNALFLIHKAQLFDMERDIRLSNVDIDGEFSNGDLNSPGSSRIVFKSFKANLESNVFEGSFKLVNFTDPQINMNLTTELYLDEIKEVFDIDTIDILKGFANASLEYNGSYNELRDFRFRDLFTKDYTVKVDLSEGTLKFKNHPLILNEISGNINLKRSLNTDSLFFKINNSDFLIKGRISKLFEYFNEKDIFNINARLYSRKLNLDELSLLFKNDKSNNDESFRFPERLALQLRLNIDNFEVGKFYATDIKGNLNYKPKMFSLHEVSFNSMNGNVKMGGVIIQKFNNDFLVKSQSRLTNINMNKMFYSFNNFGQSFITNQNLEGNLTGDIYFSSEWSDKIEVYKNTVNSDCEIIISDGELNNFEPMMGLSRFIDMEELKKVKFSTLKNNITIRNEEIIIPQMDIESSVLNLTASGTHHFNSEYEYHVKMLLSELLSGKTRKSKKRKQIEENMEEDNEGRIILYLLVDGDKEKNKVRYDRKAARTERKDNLKQEKRELRQILNEEFGWFKKDSALNTDPLENNEKFNIEFEEEKPGKQELKKEESDQKFVIEWEEDTTKIK